MRHAEGSPAIVDLGDLGIVSLKVFAWLVFLDEIHIYSSGCREDRLTQLGPIQAGNSPKDKHKELDIVAHTSDPSTPA